MKKTLQITLILILICNCSNLKKENKIISEKQVDSIIENKIIKESRILHLYDIGKPIRIEDYELTIRRTDSSASYHYKNLLDIDKNMDFRLDKKSKWLYFSGTAFQLVKESYYFDNNLSKTHFDLYETVDQFDDGMGPTLFNNEYGILNIDNGWGKFFVYLKSRNDSILTKSIISDVYK